ncbi:hypothetical protein [Deinococcus hopiensis]|uniref:Uncharacterized protein n=1 Tax=Deinococcus hopiensis KR-140 TaxID=695939 RepID=A0A1W1VVD4_9DEIO|nr:hypothetical protein [Deinococcus hopiensis]SMB97200.1 hypothetical protein SAMN00790413_06410 [Deinococcus hopiensis KR-140]
MTVAPYPTAGTVAVRAPANGQVTAWRRDPQTGVLRTEALEQRGSIHPRHLQDLRRLGDLLTMTPTPAPLGAVYHAQDLAPDGATSLTAPAAPSWCSGGCPSP